MLASSLTPWYSSAAFLAVVGVLVAVIAIAVSVILWLLGSPRRLLVFSLSDTALFSEERSRAGDELHVSLDGQPLSDPHVVSLFIENRSRQDIRGADFEEGRPLAFDLGTPILKLLDIDSGGTRMPATQVDISDSTVAIAPVPDLAAASDQNRPTYRWRTSRYALGESLAG